MNESIQKHLNLQNPVTDVCRENSFIGNHSKKETKTIPRVSKEQLSIFDHPRDNSKNQSARLVVRQSSSISANNTSVSLRRPQETTARGPQQFHLFEKPNNRFIDSLNAPSSRRTSLVKESDFAPDIFQKVRLLEEEVARLKTLNEQKNDEIKAMNIRFHSKNPPVDTCRQELEFLRAEVARLHHENGHLRSQLLSQSDVQQQEQLNVQDQVLQLEQENRDLKARYENFKKIANSGTYQDLELAMKKIQEMEAYIKSLKRKNELLEAQLRHHSIV